MFFAVRLLRNLAGSTGDAWRGAGCVLRSCTRLFLVAAFHNVMPLPSDLISPIASCCVRIALLARTCRVNYAYGQVPAVRAAAPQGGRGVRSTGQEGQARGQVRQWGRGPGGCRERGGDRGLKVALRVRVPHHPMLLHLPACPSSRTPAPRPTHTTFLCVTCCAKVAGEGNSGALEGVCAAQRRQEAPKARRRGRQGGEGQGSGARRQEAKARWGGAGLGGWVGAAGVLRVWGGGGRGGGRERGGAVVHA